MNLNERNSPQAPGAAASARMDFGDVDRINDHELNAILWRAIKGDVPMPAPLRSAFPTFSALGTGDPGE